MLKAAKAYLVTQVSTASQGDLLLMLYDTALKHLRQAIEMMRAGDVAAKGILITKSINIISELQESLNKERGGDISKNLFQLYFYCNSRLLMANLKMKTELMEEVITILSGLRQAFAQIMPSQEGVASIVPAQAPAGIEAAEVPPPRRAAPPVAEVAPSVAEAAPSVAEAAPGVAEVAQPVAETAPPAPQAPQGEAPPPAAAPAPPPVNTMRLRAASAYMNNR